MNLALFDFDGTLTTRETYGDFTRHAVSPLRRALGTPLFAPMLAFYKRGLVSGNRIRRHVAAFGLRGASVAQVHATGARFAAEHIPSLLRGDAMQRLAWHKRQGDTVVLVPGGLDFYLAPWRQTHDVELICSRMASRGDRLTGHYLGAQCVGEEKARRVRKRYDLGGYATCYAYGDTREDAAMLALAHKRFYRGVEIA